MPEPNGNLFHKNKNNITEKAGDAGKVLKHCYKLCPKCGNFTYFSDTNKFCHLCGTEYISKCPDCKEPIIYPNSEYCPTCGKRIVLEE